MISNSNNLNIVKCHIENNFSKNYGGGLFIIKV